ncbi:hypothetical protein RISK_001083 [Rhodopirellula islandica]|uniref:Transmembrane protein n=2 Tax=Rhodopirellula islandica TaxID=595434 RepID=A0A0J1EMM2_RHOIS|nr:hypothetical protein RISK_001083 [Rhodopirellula islandica]
MRLFNRDRIDRERQWVGYCIAAIFGGAAVGLLACGGLWVMLAMESGESAPDEAERWFKTVVDSDPSPFTGIQHYTQQGIDFSHFFRFRFSDFEDLTPIVKSHGLSLTQRDEPMRLEGIPSWYDSSGIPADALRFGRGGAEPILLIVDPSSRVAYFELAHL